MDSSYLNNWQGFPCYTIKDKTIKIVKIPIGFYCSIVWALNFETNVIFEATAYFPEHFLNRSAKLKIKPYQISALYYVVYFYGQLRYLQIFRLRTPSSSHQSFPTSEPHFNAQFAHRKEEKKGSWLLSFFYEEIATVRRINKKTDDIFWAAMELKVKVSCLEGNIRIR